MLSGKLGKLLSNLVIKVNILHISLNKEGN